MDARFEVYPRKTERPEIGPPGATTSGPLLIEYGWRLRDRNGKISSTDGGQGFTTRADAHRGIDDNLAETFYALSAPGGHNAYVANVVDLDQDGEVINAEPLEEYERRTAPGRCANCGLDNPARCETCPLGH